jgi:hypothetical protein
MKIICEKSIKIIGLIVLLLLFIANISHAQASKKPAKPDNFIISMEKGGCFGTCPVYTIKLYPDGKVVFDGKIYVHSIGIFKTKLNKKRAKAIKKEFDDNHFFDFKDEYTANLPDFPTTIVIYNTGGKTKKVIDYLDAPTELKNLEQLLIDIANSKNWITDPKENK